jgi:hypothetical protein
MTLIIKVNYMKKYISSLFAFITVVAGARIMSDPDASEPPVNPVNNAHDIVIAKCTTGLECDKTNESTKIDANYYLSDIEVISVLKGNTKPGPSHMMSDCWIHPGENLLLFANYDTNHFPIGHQYVQGYATEDYQVVPLPHNFLLFTNSLAGKTVEQQIFWLLKLRLQELKYEIARDNGEQSQLERELREATNNP